MAVSMQRSIVSRPFVFIALSMAAGIWLKSIFDIPPGLLLAMFIIFIVTLFIFRHAAFSCLIFCGIFLTFGAVNFTIWKEKNVEHPLRGLLPFHNVNIMGYVTEPPDQLKRTGTMCVDVVHKNNIYISLQRKFVFRLDEDFPWTVSLGDSVYLEHVSLECLPSKRNPGQFDYQNYLSLRRIIGRIVIQPETTIRLRRNPDKFRVKRILFSAREYLNQRIKLIYRDDAAGFLSAIFLGKKEYISRDIKTDFQKSGVAHILAISGLHVGFVVYIIYLLLSFFPLSRRWHNLSTILFLITYMLITGAQPPVIRATLMVSIYLLGQNLERKPDIYNTLAAAAFFILLLEPQQLFWVSFQFSFAAVFSILFFYKRMQPLEKIMNKIIPNRIILKRLISYIFRLFLVSLAAQLGTIPLMAAYFNQIPLISLILNLAVIPLVGILIPIGVLSLVLSGLNVMISLLVSQLLSHLIGLLFWLVRAAAHLPYAYMKFSSPDIFGLLIYLLIIVLIFWRPRENLKVIRPVMAASLLVLVLWKMAPCIYPAQLIMLDVGQGDAIMIKTPTGRQVLIDTGPVYQDWDSGIDVILPAIQEVGKLHCEKVIITHAHSDHIGGLFSLSEEIKMDTLYLPEMDISYFWQDSAIKIMAEKNIPVRFLKAGDHLMVDNYCRIYILAPFQATANLTDYRDYNINNVSLVTLVSIDESRILLMGDAETPVEQQLLYWNTVMKADILKIGHHGSITSSSREFLDIVAPNLALISVGESNKYDHPSRKVLDRLKKAGINYFRTDRDGSVWLQQVGQKWKVVHW
jgi:competence protein ComEC